MAHVEQTIEVNVPVSTAYNQWTQFEDFPHFMEGVKSVTQKDDTHLHWVAEVGGEKKEWDAKITDQVPDQRIAWTAVGGHGNSGVVTFHALDADSTRVDVHFEHEAEGLKEQLGSAVGLDSRRVKADLERFKEYIEARGRESGEWRGEVKSGERTR